MALLLAALAERILWKGPAAECSVSEQRTVRGVAFGVRVERLDDARLPSAETRSERWQLGQRPLIVT